MSAQLIYDLAPLGSLVRFSDGTPRPPERHRKKLAAWEHRNSGGRLIRKQPERRIGNTVIGASFTLHSGDYGGGGVVVLRVHRTFPVDSDLAFVVTERRSSVRSACSTGPARMPSWSISPAAAPMPKPGCRATAIQMPFSTR
ncbi:hypothetical protein ABIC01_008277 [Bradyrhizobium sp. RT4b]